MLEAVPCRITGRSRNTCRTCGAATIADKSGIGCSRTVVSAMAPACALASKNRYDGRHRSVKQAALQSHGGRLLMKRDTITGRLGGLLLVLAAVALPGCSSKPAVETASLTPPFLDTPVAPHPAVTAATVQKGKQIYDANCVQCHGASGRGDGYGAPFLVPPPRDLTAGQFKFRTTASGQLPTDDDLFRTISRGANGTGMPPWQYLLTDDERWALVDYVKTFDQRFASARTLKPMPLPEAPGRSRSIDRGRVAYVKMQCAKCH